MTAISQWLNYQDKDLWKSYLSQLNTIADDVYFLPEYSYLYADRESEASCFVYTSQEHIFLYPFLKSRIPGNPSYFDIATAYGYGGPVCNTTNFDFIHQAYRRFHEEAKEQNIVAELIRFHPLINNQMLFAEYPQLKLIDTCPTVHVEMNLDEEHRWNNIYPHANRKNINKAKRNNVQIHFGKDETTWQAFMDLYAETMSANQATTFYYFSDEYYQKLKNDLGENYILASAVLNDEIVSVLILLLGPSYAHCHRIGTKRAVMSLGINNYLHHETILWCKSQGLQSLLIGGGRGNTEDDSLFLFKKNFSDVAGRFYIGESIIDMKTYTLLCDEWRSNNPGKEISDRLFKYRY